MGVTEQVVASELSLCHCRVLGEQDPFLFPWMASDCGSEPSCVQDFWSLPCPHITGLCPSSSGPAWCLFLLFNLLFPSVHWVMDRQSLVILKSDIIKSFGAFAVSQYVKILCELWLLSGLIRSPSITFLRMSAPCCSQLQLHSLWDVHRCARVCTCCVYQRLTRHFPVIWGLPEGAEARVVTCWAPALWPRKGTGEAGWRCFRLR